MSLQDLLQQIEARRIAKLELQPYKRNNPIASDLGECMREMVLGITNWKDRPPMSPEGKFRADRGTAIENLNRQELGNLGFDVRVDRQYAEVRDKAGRLICRGKIDGFIKWQNRDYPFEAKTVPPFTFDKINSTHDFERWWWMKKYPRQLQFYLYANNLEEGFFHIDDLGGHWKLIPVSLDYEMMEKILKQCEAAIMHVTNKTLPDYHPDFSVCRKCWAFGRVCDPPGLKSEGMIALGDPDLAAKLDRRWELEAGHREYEALDKEVKETLKGKTNLSVGDWFITGENKIRNYKASEAKTVTFWQTNIEKISKDT